MKHADTLDFTWQSTAWVKTYESPTQFTITGPFTLSGQGTVTFAELVTGGLAGRTLTFGGTYGGALTATGDGTYNGPMTFPTSSGARNGLGVLTPTADGFTLVVNQAASGPGLHHRRARLRVGHERALVEDRRVHLGRQNGRGADAAVAQLGVQGLHHRARAGLGHAVGDAGEPARPQCRHRRHGDHGARAALEHRRQQRLRERVDACGVHAEHGVPLVLPHPPDAARVTRLAGVVDEDVHAAERLHRPRPQLACVVGLREVARLAGGRPLVALDLGDDLLERLLAATGDGDPRALGGEHEGGGAADARAGAGDERDLAFECLHGLLGDRGVPRLRRGAPSVGGLEGPYRGPPWSTGAAAARSPRTRARPRRRSWACRPSGSRGRRR